MTEGSRNTQAKNLSQCCSVYHKSHKTNLSKLKSVAVRITIRVKTAVETPETPLHVRIKYSTPQTVVTIQLLGYNAFVRFGGAVDAEKNVFISSLQCGDTGHQKKLI